MITIYGIKNCDTIKKTLRWFKEHEVDHVFHDYRQQGVPVEYFEKWVAEIDNWEILINKRGTTWRQLEANQKDSLSKANLIPLISTHPALIKRPILSKGLALSHIGYDEEVFAQLSL